MTTQVTDVSTTTPPTSSEPATPTTPLAEVTKVETPPISDPATPLAEVVVPPVDAPPAAPLAEVVVPPVEAEEYDLELAEDSPLSQTDLDAIAQEASDRGLTKDQADAVIKQREDFYNNGMAAAQKVNNDRLTEDNTNFNLDPEFSGDNRAESFALIKRATDSYGDADLVEALSDPYIGNNLPLAKFLKRIGEAMGADPIVGGAPAFKQNPGLTSEQTRLRNAYPEHFKDK